MGATIVCALPTTDDIVLEQVGSFVPQITALQTGSSGPREAAVRADRLLQQNGNDDTACRALANSMIAEVNSTVSTAQANINAVDDGSTCGSTYQTEVDAATTANTNAQSALTQAQDALNSAQAQSVTLTQAYTVDPAVTYFTNNPAWVAARNAHNDATSALATAQGAATAAATALTEAQETQTHQINVCRCTAQTAMAAALATNADSNNHQQNTANWNQAHQLLCVLDNTSPCNFGPAPTVQSRTLPADVSGATCPAPALNARAQDFSGSSGCVLNRDQYDQYL